MNYDFSGRVVLVTGGTSGIGRAMSLAFAQAGASVVASSIDADDGETTLSLIREKQGSAIFVKADVSNETQVKAMVEAAVDTYGGIDFACNNAGIALPERDVTDLEEADWDRLMNINVKGVWLCMKHQIPHMLKRQSPAIVNTASCAGLVATPGFAYTASKHAVIGLTKSIALRYGKSGLRVNSLCPSVVNTPIIAGIPTVAEAATKAIPMGRIAEPEEMANAALWLCSDQSLFVTGHSMVVDGGYILP